MKRFIFKVFVFFLAITIIDFVFNATYGYLSMHAHKGDEMKINKICGLGNYNCWQVLIMGSSKAHHGYNPQIISDSLQKTVYNAGFDGNGAIMSLGLLNLIDNEKLPQIIIYDIKQEFDIYEYEEDGDKTRYIKLLKPYFGKYHIDSIIGSVSKSELIKLHSGLYKYNGEFLTLLTGYFYDHDIDGNFGHDPMCGILDDTITVRTNPPYVVDNLKLGYFKKFIRTAKAKGIKVIAVISPEYNKLVVDEFKPIRDFCNKEGVKLLDYYSAKEFQRVEFFKDHCHLNEKGSYEFSKRFVSDLLKIIK